MKILGIDYGRSKIGIAISVNGFSEPFKVLHTKSFEDAVKKVGKEIDELKASKVVVGISEGEMEEETNTFLDALKKQQSAIEFDTSDETLTSQDAQRMSREAGVHQKKRHEMEDAYAASIMLQNYLDSFKG